jgi:hypothetical protein
MAESKKKRLPRSHKASEKGIAKAESALMHRGWSRIDILPAVERRGFLRLTT